MVLLIKLLLLMILHQISADRVTDGTDLVLAFMVHRHGDRTPIAQSISLVPDTLVDVNAINKLIAPWGYGQLTNEGRQRAYRTGQFIRHRYNGLLSETFNRSEIYIRSTDSTRAKMTVLTAMAAVYPAVGDSWSKKINWVPVPYTTVPAKYDFNLFSINCPTFSAVNNAVMYSPSTAMAKYSGLLSQLTNLLGFDLTNLPLISYGIHDILVSLNNLGYKLSSDILDLMPELSEAAGEAADVLFGDNNYVPYQAGPLLNEFFEVAAAVIAGNDTQRVRVYSAHDLNVYALEAITQIKNRQGVPKYGSLYSLELRLCRKTGEYKVLPVYLSTPEEPEMYLQVEGCDGLLCDYYRFYDITAQYLLTEDEWRSKCGFTDDLIIDTSSVD